MKYRKCLRKNINKEKIKKNYKDELMAHALSPICVECILQLNVNTLNFLYSIYHVIHSLKEGSFSNFIFFSFIFSFRSNSFRVFCDGYLLYLVISYSHLLPSYSPYADCKRHAQKCKWITMDTCGAKSIHSFHLSWNWRRGGRFERPILRHFSMQNR